MSDISSKSIDYSFTYCILVLSDVPQRKAFESRLKETSPPTATPNMPSSYEHNSSASTSATAVKSEPTHASSLPSTSTAPTTATSAANHNGPSHSIQSARDRDFRAQQSANSGPLNGGPPPRGPYRTVSISYLEWRIPAFCSSYLINILVMYNSSPKLSIDQSSC